MKRTICLRVALAVGLLLPIGCGRAPESENPQADIIGKWESNGGELTLEFKPDGKLIAHWDRGGFISNTESETVFLGETTLLGVWERNFVAYTVHIYGDEMTLEPAEGRDIKFKRVE